MKRNYKKAYVVKVECFGNVDLSTIVARSKSDAIKQIMNSKSRKLEKYFNENTKILSVKDYKSIMNGIGVKYNSHDKLMKVLKKISKAWNELT